MPTDASITSSALIANEQIADMAKYAMCAPPVEKQRGYSPGPGNRLG